MIFIAEVKTKSPFGFESQYSFDDLFDIAKHHGDWVSVHTDPRWGGSFENIQKARAETSKPILAKGFHITDHHIATCLGYGADYVLVVGRIPAKEYLLNTIVEPITFEQFVLFSRQNIPYMLWNQRNVLTGNRKEETFSEAREYYDKWLGQGSFIKRKSDINPTADSFIVGENLVEFVKQYP